MYFYVSLSSRLSNEGDRGIERSQVTRGDGYIYRYCINAEYGKDDATTGMSEGGREGNLPSNSDTLNEVTNNMMLGDEILPREMWECTITRTCPTAVLIERVT